MTHDNETLPMRWPVLVVVGTLLASACTGEATPSPQSSGARSIPSGLPSVTASSSSLAVASFFPHSHCRPARPSSSSPNGLVEVRGITSDGQLWALVFDRVPVPVHRQVKIAWRMTGTGALRLLALDSQGRVVQSSGLVRHVGSNWHRPEKEWGGYFVFPTAGCWDIQAQRGSVTGNVWLVAR